MSLGSLDESSGISCDLPPAHFKKGFAKIVLSADLIVCPEILFITINGLLWRI